MANPNLTKNAMDAAAGFNLVVDKLVARSIGAGMARNGVEQSEGQAAGSSIASAVANLDLSKLGIRSASAEASNVVPNKSGGKSGGIE